MTILIIDESWTKIDPAKAKADGYSGMIGYLSNDPSKNITAPIAAAWHALGMSVGVVWETTARRSAGGAVAGAQDLAAAEAQCLRVGVPRTVGIYYATDFDATPAQVDPYYAAIGQGATFGSGCYGGERIVDAMAGTRVRYGWQTSAWSPGISPKANLYQRLSHTLPPIGGSSAGYDEDVVLSEAGLWYPDTRPPIKPTPPGGPVVIEKGVPAPAYPLGHGQFFGPSGGGPNSISGYYSHASDLQRWQARMAHRGWHITADGRYGFPGDLTPRGQTAGVALAAQHGWGLPMDSLIGPQTWAAAWSRDITRP
jgi:hypothetical protein